MTNLIVELSKYGLAILAALYTLMSFFILKQKGAGQEKGFGLQRVILFFLHFLAYAVMYLHTMAQKKVNLPLRLLPAFHPHRFIYGRETVTTRKRTSAHTLIIKNTVRKRRHIFVPIGKNKIV